MEARERAHDMFVNFLNLSNSSWILEPSDSFLLYGKHHAFFSFEANSGSSSVDSFEGVLDLEKFAIWGKDSDCFIVS